jgi:hypothetical protein
VNLPARPIQTNFTAGELSPRMRGRVDLEQYNNAAADLTNFIVLPQGGITRRPGTHFTTSVKVQASRARLVPFVVSDLTAYVLELGANYIRFNRNRGPVLDTSGVPLELPTPYAVADLRSLRFAASADDCYITHGSHAPMKLARTSADTFTLATVAFANGPFDTENTGDIGAAAATAASTNPASPPASGGGDGGGSGDSNPGDGGGEGGGSDGGNGGDGGGGAGDAGDADGGGSDAGGGGGGE